MSTEAQTTEQFFEKLEKSSTKDEKKQSLLDIIDNVDVSENSVKEKLKSNDEWVSLLKEIRDEIESSSKTA